MIRRLLIVRRIYKNGKLRNKDGNWAAVIEDGHRFKRRNLPDSERRNFSLSQFHPDNLTEISSATEVDEWTKKGAKSAGISLGFRWDFAEHKERNQQVRLPVERKEKKRTRRPLAYSTVTNREDR